MQSQLHYTLGMGEMEEVDGKICNWLLFNSILIDFSFFFFFLLMMPNFFFYIFYFYFSSKFDHVIPLPFVHLGPDSGREQTSSAGQGEARRGKRISSMCDKHSWCRPYTMMYLITLCFHSLYLSMCTCIFTYTAMNAVAYSSTCFCFE